MRATTQLEFVFTIFHIHCTDQEIFIFTFSMKEIYMNKFEVHIFELQQSIKRNKANK